jgi:hypothetical protein
MAIATPSDTQLAQRADIPLDVLLAIRTVESGNTATAVRFEPHVFWRLRKGFPRSMSGGQMRDALTAAELALVPYTPCTLSWRTAHGLAPCVRRGAIYDRAVSLVGSETNRAAFERAYRVDPRIAIRSTSWGLYQVLGEHLLALYPQDPVGSFYAAPRRVSGEMLVSWMRANDAGRLAAQRGDLVELARRYNGDEAWGRAMQRALTRIRSEGITPGPDVPDTPGTRPSPVVEPPTYSKPTANVAGTLALAAGVGAAAWLGARWLRSRG